MTQQLFTDAGHRSGFRSSEATPRHLAAMARSAGALLAELQGSLEASQRALLSHDLVGLERATSEQIGLQRSLQALRSQNGAPGTDATPLDPALAAGLRAAQWRVLYLGRVQAALLTRAQRSLRMLSNLLAGPGANYAAPSYAEPNYAGLSHDGLNHDGLNHAGLNHAGPNHAGPGHAAPASASNRAKLWPGSMPARGASKRPGNDEGNRAQPPQVRKKNSDEEEADPCRV
ncbi:MAG: hypothetical protein ACLPHP_18085 [Candidatus Sulfotelmatobacter sp.]